MAWLRLDDKRVLHRKFRRQGFAARGLDEAAACWCAHQETDGFLSDDALEDLAHHHGVSVPVAKKLAAQLVDPMDRWERAEDRPGWWVKGYLESNPSHAELEAKRKRDRERKRVAAESGSGHTGSGEES